MAATTLDCGAFIVLNFTYSAVNLPARSQAARQLNGSINPETWPSASYATRQDLGFTDRNGLTVGGGPVVALEELGHEILAPRELGRNSSTWIQKS